jgi:hypothetical protein
MHRLPLYTGMRRDFQAGCSGFAGGLLQKACAVLLHAIWSCLVLAATRFEAQFCSERNSKTCFVSVGENDEARPLDIYLREASPALLMSNIELLCLNRSSAAARRVTDLKTLHWIDLCESSWICFQWFDTQKAVLVSLNHPLAAHLCRGPRSSLDQMQAHLESKAPETSSWGIQ